MRPACQPRLGVGGASPNPNARRHSLASKVLKLLVPQFPPLHKQGHATHLIPWLGITGNWKVPCKKNVLIHFSVAWDVLRDPGWGLMSVHGRQVPSLFLQRLLEKAEATNKSSPRVPS